MIQPGMAAASVSGNLSDICSIKNGASAPKRYLEGWCGLGGSGGSEISGDTRYTTITDYPLQAMNLSGWWSHSVPMGLYPFYIGVNMKKTCEKPAPVVTMILGVSWVCSIKRNDSEYFHDALACCSPRRTTIFTLQDRTNMFNVFVFLLFNRAHFLQMSPKIPFFMSMSGIKLAMNQRQASCWNHFRHIIDIRTHCVPSTNHKRFT